MAVDVMVILCYSWTLKQLMIMKELASQRSLKIRVYENIYNEQSIKALCFFDLDAGPVELDIPAKKIKEIFHNEKYDGYFIEDQRRDYSCGSDHFIQDILVGVVATASYDIIIQLIKSVIAIMEKRSVKKEYFDSDRLIILVKENFLTSEELEIIKLSKNAESLTIQLLDKETKDRYLVYRSNQVILIEKNDKKLFESLKRFEF